MPDDAIQKINYTHDACIDAIIAHPTLSQGQLAAMFGYSQGWLSRVMSSSAFKARLGERRAELVDPSIVNGIEENMEALTLQSIAVLQAKLDSGAGPDVALKTLEVTTRALGYGAKLDRGVQINQQFVVSTPSKSANGHEWAQEWAPVARRGEEHLVEPVAGGDAE